MIVEDSVITIGGILIFINFISIAFAIYSHFRKPQDDNTVSIAILNQTINSIEKAFDSKIISVEKNLNNLRDNHLHTLDNLSKSIDKNGDRIADLTIRIGELKGLLEEHSKK